MSGSAKVELPCLVDQANCGEVYYITWTKNHHQTNNATNLDRSSIQTLSSNSHSHQQWNRVYLYTGANDSSPHKPIGDLLNRAHFVMPDKREAQSNNNIKSQVQLSDINMAHLIIEEPRASDEALYKCDVTYVKGKCPSISLVRLNVLIPPSKAQIIENNNNNSLRRILNEAQLVGPYDENQELKLTCLVVGGRPGPRSVIWRKIDSLGRTINLQHSPTTTSTSTTNNFKGSSESSIELELNHTLSSNDLGAKFECHVEHEAIDLQSPVRIINSHDNDNEGHSKIKGISPNVPDFMLDLHPARGLQTMNPMNTQNELIGIDSMNMNINNNNIRSQFDSHVLIDLNVAPSSLDLFKSKINNANRNMSEPLKEGDLIELECIAYNAKPAANISWFNGQEHIEQQSNSNNVDSNIKLHSRHKRLLQRQQIHQNPDGQTFDTHSFLSIKLSRHENGAQISCRAQNSATRQALVKSLELQVERK